MKVKVKAEPKSTAPKTVVIARKKIATAEKPEKSASPESDMSIAPLVLKRTTPVTKPVAETDPEIPDIPESPQLPEVKLMNPVKQDKKKKLNLKKSINFFLCLLVVGCICILVAVNYLGKNPSADRKLDAEEETISATEATTEPLTEPPTEEPTVAETNYVLEIDPDKPMIALTYDDGPALELSDRILDTLEEYHAHATFFLVGDNITENTEKILKREVDLGCEIGNHTLSHKNLEKLDLEDAVLQLSECDDKIYQCTGTKASLVRPPYGAYNDAIREADKRMFIYWSLNTNDWKREDPDEICDIVMEYIDDGDIILMHDIHEQSVKASEKLIPALIEQGYQLVTVSELIHYRNLNTEDGMVLFNVHPEGAFFNSLYGTVCDYELARETFSYDEEAYHQSTESEDPEYSEDSENSQD